MKVTFALLNKELHSRWLSLAIFSLIGCAFALMYVALFPAIKQQSAQLTQVMQSMSSTFKAMGIENLGFTSLESFLSLEYFSLLWPILTIIFISSWTGSLLAGETEQGTMGLLLALPFGRQRIYWTKYTAILVALVVFSLLSILTIMPLASAFGIEYTASHFLRTMAMCLVFGWSFLSLGMMASSIWSERGRVAMTVGGVALLMYVATAMAGLQDSLSWLKYLSFFSYADIQNVLVKNQWHWHAVLVFIIFSLITTIIGAWYFNRRDIAV